MTVFKETSFAMRPEDSRNVNLEKAIDAGRHYHG